jgi:uncharacterized protein YcgI (DUF1989 family)
MPVTEIPAGHGCAVPLKTGAAIRLTNTHGTQVVDTWALAAGDMSEVLSVEHTRRMLYNLFPKQGDAFYSNRRNKMLLLEQDTAPGRHDMLLAACDSWLYKHYGCALGHRNCCDNFREALGAAGYDAAPVPNPVNLWMNIPVIDNGRIELRAPESRRGDHVLLRALIDVIVVFSACPMDVTPINGEDRQVKPVHFEVI